MINMESLDSILQLEEELRELFGEMSCRSFIHMENRLCSFSPKEISELVVCLNSLKCHARVVRHSLAEEDHG